MERCRILSQQGLAYAIVALGLSTSCVLAHAAQYKWTDSGGRVHYSDRPPQVDPRSVAPAPSIEASAAGAHSAGQPALPWALRSSASRYPVVLYTTLDCEPCETARAHLARRGIPYTEKSVASSADLKAFETLGFSSALFPSASVGREKLTGYEQGNWDRTLDASGYPKTSMLPANYAARRVEPMRDAPAPSLAQAAAKPSGTNGDGHDEARAAAPDEATAHGTGVDTSSLLTPSSFKTGPNPIRF